MARVLTFSRTFPAYHPKAGQSTHFVEKFWNSIKIQDLNPIQGLGDEKQRFCFETFAPKHHTIRAGSRWKVGDMFSPRVWSGKPRNSKQIVIAPDTRVVKVWNFELKFDEVEHPSIYLNDKFYSHMGAGHSLDIAKNDGLSIQDLEDWFKCPSTKGQIICWNESVNY